MSSVGLGCLMRASGLPEATSLVAHSSGLRLGIHVLRGMQWQIARAAAVFGAQACEHAGFTR